MSPGAVPLPDAPPDAAVERFRRDLTALAGEAGVPPPPLPQLDDAGHAAPFRALPGADPESPTSPQPIAVAVSGGADSMALLALAHAAWPGGVIAATVDHRLRPEGADEAEAVARWCDAAGVPHAILPILESAPATGNRHAWARTMRYRLLAAWAGERNARALCTAHHADDQAETFLMRANRGAGVAGLAGVRARSRIGSLPLLRPLLGWSRAELRALAPLIIDDPSNADPRYERTRVRQALAATAWLDARAVARSAAQLAELDAELAALTDWLWAERVRGDLLDLTGVPRELRRRLVRRVTGGNGNIEPLLDALEAGRAATQGDWLFRPSGGCWRFSPAPPRKPR